MKNGLRSYKCLIGVTVALAVVLGAIPERSVAQRNGGSGARDPAPGMPTTPMTQPPMNPIISPFGGFAGAGGSTRCLICFSPGPLAGIGGGLGGFGQQVEPWATLRGHKKLVTSLAFSPDGRTLASGSLDETIRLWEVASGRERLTLRGRGRDNVVFSPDGKLLASGGASGVRLWDVVGMPRAPRRSHPDSCSALAFSPNGRTLAVGLWPSSKRPQRGMLRLWDVRTGARGPALQGRTGAVFAIAFSPDGRTVAAGDDRGVVTFWEMASGGVRMTRNQHEGWVYALGFVAGVKVMASGGSQGPARLWEPDTGRVRAILGPLGAGVWDISLTPGGKLLASASPGSGLRLWDTVCGKQLLIVELDSPARSVKFSPDGKLLAAGGAEGTIRLWSVSKLLASKGTK